MVCQIGISLPGAWYQPAASRPALGQMRQPAVRQPVAALGHVEGLSEPCLASQTAAELAAPVQPSSPAAMHETGNIRYLQLWLLRGQ